MSYSRSRRISDSRLLSRLRAFGLSRFQDFRAGTNTVGTVSVSLGFLLSRFLYFPGMGGPYTGMRRRWISTRFVEGPRTFGLRSPFLLSGTPVTPRCAGRTTIRWITLLVQHLLLSLLIRLTGDGVGDRLSLCARHFRLSRFPASKKSRFLHSGRIGISMVRAAPSSPSSQTAQILC